MMLLKAGLLVAGVASHLFYFRRGEHHMYGIRYIQLTLATVFAATIVLIASGSSTKHALSVTFLHTGYYFPGIYTSLIFFRIFIGPLRHFPGPIGARISNLWLSAQLRKLDAHHKLLALHQRYGDFVRVGSHDLSITDPKAVEIIYGPASKCAKSDWYDLTQPVVSMQTTRDKGLHTSRRRLWSSAFSDKALRSYEKRIKIYQDQLIDRIASMKGEAIDVTRLSKLYNFDVMGDLAFGKPFDTLNTGHEHWAITLIGVGMAPLGLMLPSWLFRIFFDIPPISRQFWNLLQYCCSSLDERMQTEPDKPDILSSLLNSWRGKTPTDFDMKMLQGDTQLIIIAGSDTTASALAHVLHELARSSNHVSKIRAELAHFTPEAGDIDHHDLQHLPYLNSIIFETLRLFPPSGLVLKRLTPAEGIMIGETWIPGNTTVFCPQYVISRSEKAYCDATNFRPERWYEKPEMVKEPTAFAPFSTGPYACIGKSLALMNLRTTIAKLVLRFDISFAPGEDGTALEAQTREQFTTRLGPLCLSFKVRKD